MMDWERVAELRAEVGAEAFAEVVELFLEEVDEAVARLRGGVDDAEIPELLHFLKGSALNLGFAQFARECSAGERRAAENPGAGAPAIPALIDCYERSRAAFLGRLGADCAAA